MHFYMAMWAYVSWLRKSIKGHLQKHVDMRVVIYANSVFTPHKNRPSHWCVAP